jgi:hypothetical protein
LAQPPGTASMPMRPSERFYAADLCYRPDEQLRFMRPARHIEPSYFMLAKSHI